MIPFPVQEIRAQFPALASGEAFLDNPAGTQVPRRVAEAVAATMPGAASNLGGYFRTSRAAVDIYLQAHDAMADLLGGASGREIVLGQSMTMLTFHLSRTIGREWRAGDEIIITRMEHEGNVAPWLALARDRGLIVRWLPFNRETWRVEPDDLRPLLNERTRLLALNFASNLTGSINPVAELSRIAREAGALVYVDAVQLVPHAKPEVAQLGCDFLACSAYKFFGPHLGVLWGREALLGALEPYAVRCVSQDLPWKHELGTSQTELFAGLSATADYLVWLGGKIGGVGTRGEKIAAAYRAATAYEMPLAQQLIDGLKSLPHLTIHGISSAARLGERVPTVSLSHAHHRNSALAKGLADRGINVWSGHNYALEVARHLGLDEDEGVLRIGLAHYNTADEVTRVLNALEELTR